ncbi:hypothetical protein BC777_3661 [Yoonia maricola]|uniref:Uncharacterized protein n=1 Tax=Yoonia maricola TaxID=420999 RepID=A0A2M8W105_9RHOB|nr:hypothetical protein [Yoonia maricola]PJI84600.1 hypothetical protein BC777_3661 [Yoonia maricola]
MFRFNRSRLQQRLQNAPTSPLEELQARLNARPEKTSLGGAPMTDAERQWVHLALQQRRALIVWRYVATALTLLLVAFLPIWIITLGYMTTDRPLVPVTRGGAAIFFAVVLFCVGLSVMTIWTQRVAFQNLRHGLFARVPKDLAAITATGQLHLRGDDEEIVVAMAISRPGQSVRQDIYDVQIPAHWAKYVTDKPYELRLAKVSASDISTTIRSLIVFRHGDIGGINHLALQYATYSDALYVLLAAGPFSVDSEVKAGLGMPRLRSGAALQIYISKPIVCAFIAMGAWIWLDVSNGVPPALQAVFAVFTAALLPLTFTVLSRRAINRRTVQYYELQR